MKNKKTTHTIATVVFFLTCVTIGGLLGFSLTQGFGDTLSWWQLILRIVEGVALFLLAFFFQVVLHEAGHMLAALIRGWSFIHFMVLGVVLTRRDGRFHLSRFAVPGVGGQCLMMPPREGDTNFGVAFYNAGGVLVNLIVAILSAVLLVRFYEDNLWDINVFMGSLCFTGIVFALINGIPSVAGDVPNDGMNICELKKDKYATQVFLTTMRILGQLQQGKSLVNVVDTYLADGVQLDFTNPIHIVAINFDLSLAVAKLDFEKAHVIMKRIEPEFDKIVPIYQKEITYERVFLYLVSPRDNVDVGLLIDPDTLKYFEMQTCFRPTALRVKYTFARLYECDESKAAAIYEQFQRVCANYHIPGEVLEEKKLVEYVRTLKPLE